MHSSMDIKCVELCHWIYVAQEMAKWHNQVNMIKSALINRVTTSFKGLLCSM